MYGYAGESWMVKYCHKKKIPFIVERVDWFENLIEQDLSKENFSKDKLIKQY